MLQPLTDFEPTAVQTRISHATGKFALVAALFVTSTSFVAMSLGDPELMAFVALTGVLVLAVGLLALSAERTRLPASPRGSRSSASD